jgi:aryl-alcohol dehydrogenase-like predicted oxidoreductase
MGESGLRVSALGLGTMVFGEDGPRGTPEAAAARMLDAFLDAGGTHVDTANVYAGGRSEEIVGRALKGRRDRVTLATKVRFATGDGPNDQGLSRVHVLRAVEASLARLGTDHVDLLYAHCWDPWTPLEETLAAFDELVRRGMTRYLAVSNFRGWQLAKALTMQRERGLAPFVAAQYQYSLVERDIEPEFESLCWDEGVGLVPWGPLGGGFLTGKYRRGEAPDEATGRIGGTPDHAEEAWRRRDRERNWRTLEAVREVAAAHDATPAQVALAWLLSRPSVATVLVGVRTPDQLDDNLAAARLTLGEDEIALLDGASAPEPRYPYRMIDVYGARG